MASNNDQYVEALKPGYRLLYKDKTRDELVRLQLDAAKFIAQMSYSASDLAEGRKQSAISQVCNELIQEIDEKKRRNEEARSEFKEKLGQLKRECIFNLKTAASANGQLVAAILEEEDGLTADQIGSWCEEMEALDEESLEELLNSLVEEGIIERDEEGAYHLLYILTDNLKAFPASDWARNKLGYDKLSERQRYLLDVLWLDEAGYTSDDIVDGKVDKVTKILAEEMLDSVTKSKYSDEATDLSKCQYDFRRLSLKDNLIDSYRASNGALVYHYPLLGKKEEEDNEM